MIGGGKGMRAGHGRLWEEGNGIRLAAIMKIRRKGKVVPDVEFTRRGIDFGKSLC
jgi:hypothetical protein